ncbi:CHC2 zinc finger domain-containing protein [Variovorax sp. J22P240]|uniref:CHC2 zinc finger domain-containing protein n=1 Tax=Variovorax sp. J22P240 TaxID=3053514 RepID=UPI0025781C5E|nr:CHC2 zinc finger domain-containing protein [Variovorax sp. J22P240]MDL9998265.1 CHC2 zinc finger domain-containing protein [Variovorax sp. J22P240]
MSYDRARLPDPVTFYEEHRGLKLLPGKLWRTTRCEFHEGSDSMRVNVRTGAFKCMNCQEAGGDVVAYLMQVDGIDFVMAAKALGAWVDDGRPAPANPMPFTARDALSVCAFELSLAAICAGNMAQGVALSDDDRARLCTCANRVQNIHEWITR